MKTSFLREDWEILAFFILAASSFSVSLLSRAAKMRCICSCAKRGYFTAPRGDVSAHAQREDISLRQEEMFLPMRKKRIFRCAKRRCFSSYAIRGYFIAPRGNVPKHAQRENISLRQEKMLQCMRKVTIFHCPKRRCFSSCAKRGYFIAPRGDVLAHVQRKRGYFIKIR